MSDSYKFRLNSLLKIREGIRDLRMSELGQLTAAEKEIRLELDQWEEKLVELRLRWQEAQQCESPNVETLNRFFEYHRHLQKQKEETALRLQAAESKVLAKRAELDEAVKGVKILENLRQRQQEAWDEARQREDLRQMDELSSNRYNNDE